MINKRIKNILWLLVIAFMITINITPSDVKARDAGVEKAKNSIVKIYTGTQSNTGNFSKQKSGNGFIIAKTDGRNYIVTSHDVINTSKKSDKVIKVVVRGDTTVEAQLLTESVQQNYAILVVEEGLENKGTLGIKDQMEKTGIENLDAELKVPATDDEVQAVGIAYQNLMQRLNESIVKEKRMSLLQLQAQFDTLQAQVNPHFLYNVLNVISSRGIMDGDEEICEICGCLAAMLRYSTSTKERYATVEKELEYLDRYIFLLKSRYEHRLEVKVDCEESVKQEQLPKIVLQQLVENSIQHGYNNSKNIMKIQVKGWRDETGWYFEVRDNGQGATEEVREELNEKMRKIREKIMSRGSSIEMEIGGMGLANTYARMFLLYNGKAVFRIRNMEEGLSVIIGVSEKEERTDVSGDGR